MRVAAVDIGTNTVRLLVVEAMTNDGHLELQVMQRREVITKLGEGLDATGRLGEEPMMRALNGLSAYADLIEAADVAAVGGVATAATRSAANGDVFAARINQVLGFQPRVIDGIEEARLTFLGATATRPQSQSYAVVDVGGGSTEFVVGRHVPDYAVSVDIGSVRLTERMLALGITDITAIRAYVDELFARVVTPIEPSVVLGSGGTFVTLAAVARNTTTAEVEQAGEVVLSFADLVSTVDQLARMRQSDIGELPAVPPARAGVLQAGAVCAERAIARWDAQEVQISVRDILDGLAMELATQQWPGAVARGHSV